MAYRSLLTVFYTDREQHQRCYEERFYSDNATIFPLKIKENTAFYLLTKEIHQRMLSIYKQNTQVKEVQRLLPDAALLQFWKRCLIDEIVLTNEIEGVVSTRKDINAVLENVKPGKEQRFQGLIHKYLKLVNQETIPLESCQDIRDLYDELFLKEVLENDPQNRPDGKIFRKGSVSVQTETQKEIHRGLEPEQRIIDAMEQALALLADEENDILIRIAVLHYYLGYIHPFYDGNGRLSRFISSYLVSKYLDPMLAYRLSYLVRQNIRQYYDAFKTCNDLRNKGDLTPFIEMFLSILEQSMEQLLEALQKRRVQLDYYDQRLTKEALAPYGIGEKGRELVILLVQAELFAENGVSTTEILDDLKVSRGTFEKLRKELEQLGLLKEEAKQGNKKFYGIHLEKLDALLQQASGLQ